MRKEYKDAIISGVVGAILGTALLYIIQGKVAWAYLFTYPIFTFILHLYLKRREAKKEESESTAKQKLTKGAQSGSCITAVTTSAEPTTLDT